MLLFYNAYIFDKIINMKRKYYLTSLLFIPFISLISCSNVTKHPFKDVEKVEERTLNFYALNDFHGAFMYDESYNQTGLSKIGQFLTTKKENDPENTIILSSGDMFQGGAESNITRGKIIIDSMNEIGFDSMTIGNHEFDWGEETLIEMEKQMNFPLLGINIFYANTNKRPSFLTPSTIVEREGIRIGIIGSIMSGIQDSILSTISSNYDYAYSEDLIKNEAIRLREKEYCDVVVVSSHDGYYKNYKELYEYVDALFLGHSHRKLEGDYNGIPYIQGGENGNYISNISLNLKLDKETNRYKVVKSSTNNIDTFSTCFTSSSKVDNVYNKYKNQIESKRDEVLYNFKTPVSEAEFGLYISKALKDYVNENDNIFKYKVSSGIMNGGGVRSDIPIGEFTYGDLIKIYPFENVTTILKMDKSQYDTFTTSSGMYIVKDDIASETDGYYYVVTNDYSGYKANYTSLFAYDDYLIRDIVSSNLKIRGYY